MAEQTSQNAVRKARLVRRLRGWFRASSSRGFAWALYNLTGLLPFLFIVVTLSQSGRAVNYLKRPELLFFASMLFVGTIRDFLMSQEASLTEKLFFSTVSIVGLFLTTSQYSQVHLAEVGGLALHGIEQWTTIYLVIAVLVGITGQIFLIDSETP